MKQWTNNPAANSRARGTILLSLVIGCFAPSPTLLPVVQAFILEGPKGFVPYQNLLLRRTLHNGQRMEPPCQLELAATKKKQILRIKVVTDLCTGDSASARLDPASTADEWVDEIKNQLGLKKSYGWSIFMDRSGKLISLRGAGGKGMHIMDAISKVDQEAASKGIEANLNVTGQFSFRKEMFAPDHNSLKDPIGTHLIMHQIQYGIKTGYFKPAKDDHYNLLAAQMYYSLYGDDFDAKRLKDCVKAWFPEAVLKVKGSTLSDRLPKIEKLSATEEFARKSFSKVQTEGLVVKYAMDHWGKVDTFSSDNALMLMRSK